MPERTFTVGDRVQVAALVPGNVKPWRHGTVRSIHVAGDLVSVVVRWDGRASDESMSPSNLIHVRPVTFNDDPPPIAEGAIEQTPDGAQVLVTGAPRRAMPTARLRPTRAQSSVADTPLFGQDRPPESEQLPLT